MVGIDKKGGIKRVLRKIYGFDRPKMGDDVGDAEVFALCFEETEHFRLDVDGDDFSLGDQWCDAEGVVAGARADIGDDGVRVEVEEGNGFGGGFLFFAFGAFEPAHAGVSHDLGNFAAHEDFSGPIQRRWGGGVGRDFWGRPNFFRWKRSGFRCGLFACHFIAKKNERDEEDDEQDGRDKNQVSRFHENRGR